jgi:hypothetical protein
MFSEGKLFLLFILATIAISIVPGLTSNFSTKAFSVIKRAKLYDYVMYDDSECDGSQHDDIKLKNEDMLEKKQKEERIRIFNEKEREYRESFSRVLYSAGRPPLFLSPSQSFSQMFGLSIHESHFNRRGRNGREKKKKEKSEIEKKKKSLSQLLYSDNQPPSLFLSNQSSNRTSSPNSSSCSFQFSNLSSQINSNTDDIIDISDDTHTFHDIIDFRSSQSSSPLLGLHLSHPSSRSSSPNRLSDQINGNTNNIIDISTNSFSGDTSAPHCIPDQKKKRKRRKYDEENSNYIKKELTK